MKTIAKHIKNVPSRNKNRANRIKTPPKYSKITANCIKMIPAYIKITASWIKTIPQNIKITANCTKMIKIPTCKQQKLPNNQYASIMNNVYYCKNLNVCTRTASARFRRSTAQRLGGICSYTAYALQRAAPLQQNASILLGLGATNI